MVANDHSNASVRLTQARKILNHYLSIETEALCVVSFLNRKEKDGSGRFDPEKCCAKQMDTLFTMEELSKSPHVLVLTATLWYRVISMVSDFSLAELLACSYTAALAAAGGFNEEEMKVIRQTQDILSTSGMAGLMTGDKLRKGCLKIVEKLGFQLFEPTILHILDILNELRCLPADENDSYLMEFASSTKGGGSVRTPKNIKFYQTLLLMLREPRFLCLAPSMQAAGILRYLHMWNGNCARHLRRSDEEALNVAKLIYYRMAVLARREGTQDSAHQLYVMGFYDPRNEIFVENTSTGDIIREIVVFDMVDRMFSRTCSMGDCSVPLLSDQTDVELPRAGAKFPYSTIPTSDDFGKKFQKVKDLGQGGYGQVMQAVERATGVQYAMKFMRLDMNDQTFFINLVNMIHEIAGMRYLQSERGIMNTVHAFYIPEMGAVVQQITLYEGSLNDSIRMNFSITFYKSVIQGALVGLQKMHDAGLVHCDVKSANILIDSSFQSVIADMGMVALPCTTTNSDSYYTINYRAPEVSEHGRISWQSDMWAVGIILLEFYYVIEKNVPVWRVFMEILNDIVTAADPQLAGRLRAGHIPWTNVHNSFIREANMRFVEQSLQDLKSAYENPFVDLAYEWGHMHDLLSRRLLIPITKETSRWTAAACLQHEFFQTY